MECRFIVSKKISIIYLKMGKIIRGAPNIRQLFGIRPIRPKNHYSVFGRIDERSYSATEYSAEYLLHYSVFGRIPSELRINF